MNNALGIIAIGASAGGVGALRKVVAGLDPDIQAAIFVVLHLPPNHRSHLPAILSRSGPLPATNAREGMPVEPGNIYVAPPDLHLLIGSGHMHVARGPKVNRSRPAIDLLFQSAANSYGAGVIGVVLSGLLDDGTRGLASVKRQGGYALVQDPDEAAFDGMPRNAIESIAVDGVLPAAAIGPRLNELVHNMRKGAALVPEKVPQDAMTVPGGDDDRPSSISAFTCPDCNGTLWEIIDEGALVHYQCRVGHSFTPSNLLAAQVDEVEALLWAALRAMEERDAMYRKILERSQKFTVPTLEGNVEAKIETNRRHAALLQEILLGEGAASISETDDSASSVG